MAENVEMHNVADYWQIALGGSSYTPKVHGKHVASHPKTVAQAMRIAGQRCPEVADVIAALVWKMSLAENRAEWVSKVSDETRAEAAATLTALRARIEELETFYRAVAHAAGDLDQLPDSHAFEIVWASGDEDGNPAPEDPFITAGMIRRARATLKGETS